MDEQDAAAYLQHRSLLFTISYQMTGSVEDAEDVVSEVFLRYQRAVDAGTRVESPRAFLTTTTTRLCIDYLRSARHKRETYLGPWLPEPLLVDPQHDVTARAEVADSLSMAFLVLLESLTPAERAAFLLHEVFRFKYADIARIIDKTEANCRQLVKRAKAHVAEGSPRFEASRADRDRIARGFFAAVEQGDLDALVGLLAGDVVAYGDGGGVGPSLPRPVYGRDRVVRLLAGLSEQMHRSNLHVEPVAVNGQPGATIRDSAGLLLNVFSLDIVDGQVQTVRSIINPDKLRHLGPLLDPRTLRARGRHEGGR